MSSKRSSAGAHLPPGHAQLQLQHVRTLRGKIAASRSRQGASPARAWPSTRSRLMGPPGPAGEARSGRGLRPPSAFPGATCGQSPGPTSRQAEESSLARFCSRCHRPAPAREAGAVSSPAGPLEPAPRPRATAAPTICCTPPWPGCRKSSPTPKRLSLSVTATAGMSMPADQLGQLLRDARRLPGANKRFSRAMDKGRHGTSTGLTVTASTAAGSPTHWAAPAGHPQLEQAQEI